jgi:TonB family protein
MFSLRSLVLPVLLLGASAALLAQTDAAHSDATAHLKDEACGKPAYPASLRGKEAGTVHMALLVDPAGAVLDAKLARSSGYRDLDRAALAAFSRCAFVPAYTGGKAQQSWAMLAYTFTPEPGGAAGNQKR